MAFTRAPTDTGEGLYEPMVQTPVNYNNSNQLFLPSLKLGMRVIAELMLGLIIIVTGVSAAGSYFGSASEKFSGIFATIFYSYQLGNVLIISGIILIYDAVKSIRRS